jgi:hypothetical protein
MGLATYLIPGRHLFFRAQRSRSEVAETYDVIPMHQIDFIVGGERGHTFRAWTFP